LRHRRNRTRGASPYRFASTDQPGNGFHQQRDQRALSIAKSTACERFLYREGWGKLRWKASPITGTSTAYLDPSTPAIPLGYPGRAPVTGMQLMDILTNTNICSANRTERVVDLGGAALDGRVLLP
jgi:hypothetical protein